MPDGQQSAAAAAAAERAAAGAWPSVAALGGFAFVAAELLLLVVVAERFRLESLAFRRLFWLVLFGFVIHHWLRPQLRLPFFLALSVASLPLVLGMEGGSWHAATAFARAGALASLGLALLGICHLPLAAGYRVLLLVAGAGALAFSRAGWLVGPELAPIWPILGSMFMFRLIVYFYDLEHEKERPTFARAASYLLMLPNVCFPLFPVVDYKTFRRSHYSDEALRIYQNGLNWMTRGIVQLVLYRLVYYHAYIDPKRVSDGADLVSYLVFNFALYLRVSGQFHLIVGILHLFGFKLPETNRKYFLAESFTDFWRRVNVYFKDFMVKIFYYPAAFRLRRFGTTPAIVGATAFCFVMTWFLHSYQWYWLRGSFPVTSQDAVFWGALGVLVVINSVWEQVRPRPRTLSRRRGWRRTAGAAARAAGTFAVIASLWSLWSSASWDEWLALWSFVDRSFLAYGALVLGLVAATVLALEATSNLQDWLQSLQALGALRLAPLLRVAAVGCVLPAVLLYAVGGRRVPAWLGPEAAFVVESLRSTGLNAADLGAVERGYYENLLEVARFNLELNEVYMNKPAGWLEFFDTDLWQPTHDRRFEELAPQKHEVIDGTTIRINRFGMRDREYDQAKPSGTYRIAMLGSSHVMGWGVNDGETFEEVLEARLNGNREDEHRVEDLNFGVPGYSPYCQLDVLEKKVLAFSPDAVFLVAHVVDPSLNVERFARSVREGVDLRDEYLRGLAARAGIDAKTPEVWVRRRMAPLADEFVAWTYARIADYARAHGAVPVWVYLPRVSEGNESLEAAAKLRRAAEVAGMEIVDLRGIFGREETVRIAFTPWDLHPNARGHVLIADALYDALRRSPRLSFLAGVELNARE